jgi:hypothetical protein
MVIHDQQWIIIVVNGANGDNDSNDTKITIAFNDTIGAIGATVAIGLTPLAPMTPMAQMSPLFVIASLLQMSTHDDYYLIMIVVPSKRRH